MNFIKTASNCSKIFRSQNYIRVDGANSSRMFGNSAVVGAPESGGPGRVGPGGTIKEGGGGMSRLGIAKEEGYFYGKQREQLQKLKNKLERQKKAEEQIQKKEE